MGGSRRLMGGREPDDAPQPDVPDGGHPRHGHRHHRPPHDEEGQDRQVRGRHQGRQHEVRQGAARVRRPPQEAEDSDGPRRVLRDRRARLVVRHDGSPLRDPHRGGGREEAGHLPLLGRVLLHLRPERAARRLPEGRRRGARRGEVRHHNIAACHKSKLPSVRCNSTQCSRGWEKHLREH